MITGKFYQIFSHKVCVYNNQFVQDTSLELQQSQSVQDNVFRSQCVQGLLFTAIDTGFIFQYSSIFFNILHKIMVLEVNVYKVCSSL